MLSPIKSFKKRLKSLKEIEEAFREFNCIKYAAYRTAAKLRVIQKALYMDKVPLHVISNVFERHQLQQTENSVKLDQTEVHSLLSDIYFVIEKENEGGLDGDLVCQLLTEFLLNLYDRKMTNLIQVLSMKICLTVLCQAKPREKYHYLFCQMSDHNNCLSKRKLGILLKKMIRITEYIHEGLSFGSELVVGTVESCFQSNIGTLGISEEDFIKWLMQDPQLLVWLSTFYRMQISESVLHNVKCVTCKTCPIVGLRYRCLRCLSCDLCQSCFFTGSLNKKHKLKHPVQEYCYPVTSQQSTKAFLLTLKNMLYRKDTKLQYLPALKIESKETERSGHSTRLLDDSEISSRTLVNGSRISLRKFPYRELQSIILHLEKESEKLIPQIENFCESLKVSEEADGQSQLKNCLLKHRSQVAAQIQRLKLLRNFLISSDKFSSEAFFASTPVVEEILSHPQKRFLGKDLNDFSPIIRKSFNTESDNHGPKRMLWDNYDLNAGNHVANKSWEEVTNNIREGNTLEVSPESKNGISKEAIKDSLSTMSLSTYLGGNILREPEESTNRGFTWLRDNNYVEGTDDEIRKENMEVFEELQSDLQEILNKLQEFSVATSNEGISRSENMNEREQTKMETAVEIDVLLGDLLNGIEKLIAI